MMESNSYNLIGRAVVIFNVILFGYMYISTELLSLAKAIDGNSIRLTWALFVLLCIVFIIFNRKKLMTWRIKDPAEIKSILGYVIVIVFIILMGAIMASIIVPCNGDSMVYHLPRVMNWMQNKSVSYYFTYDERQLFSQPLAEYTILNIYLLKGDDQLVNMVQWYGYSLAALLLFFILKKCDVDTKFACVGSILSMTAPIIVLESVTTQNDVFAGIWALMYLYLSLDFTVDEKIRIGKEEGITLCALGLIAGLAFMSKAQGVIPVAVISVWMLITRIKKKDTVATIIAEISIIIVISLAVAMPYFVRNYSYCGDILASEYFGDLSIGTADPRGILINIYKNWAMGAISYTNTIINRAIYYVGWILSWVTRFPINDKRITGYTNWSDSYFVLAEYDMNSASAPIVCWLFLVAVLLAIFSKRHGKNRSGIKYAVGISVIFVLAYVRWQPWVTRLLVPVYMLMCLFIILVFDEYISSINKRYVVSTVLPLIAVFFAMPAFYKNYQYVLRAIHEDRFTAYFDWIGEFDEHYEMANYISEVDSDVVGFLCDGGFCEYPLWHALKENGKDLIYINLEDDNMVYPDCIVMIDDEEYSLGDIENVGGREYTCYCLCNGGSKYTIWEAND